MTLSILTCSPYFVDLALNELSRCQPQVTISERLAPGYTLLQAPFSFDKLTHPWRHRSPIYLHHLFPVHTVLSLGTNFNNLTALKNAIEKIAPSDADLQIRSAVESGWPIAEIQQFLSGNRRTTSIQKPRGRVLSVLITPEQQAYRAYLGVSWATQNLSPWAGGQIPITESVPNRAGYKLLESLDVFSIHLRNGDHALDLGAAPGAWTTLLRRRGLRVTAVAPTALYPWLTFDEGVNYQPMLAEEFLERCQTTFDLIVNDMKLDVQDSARLMVDYARHLRSGGIAIMTLKLRNRNFARVMDHSFRILRKVYKIIQVRQLVSNRHEVTLFLRRKE